MHSCGMTQVVLALPIRGIRRCGHQELELCCMMNVIKKKKEEEDTVLLLALALLIILAVARAKS